MVPGHEIRQQRAGMQRAMAGAKLWPAGKTQLAREIARGFPSSGHPARRQSRNHIQAYNYYCDSTPSVLWGMDDGPGQYSAVILLAGARLRRVS